jgi:hypothetical protein
MSFVTENAARLRHVCVMCGGAGGVQAFPREAPSFLICLDCYCAATETTEELIEIATACAGVPEYLDILRHDDFPRPPRRG